MSTTGPLDQLQQVHELNRAFLGLLQVRAREDRACLGLPPVVRPTVASAGGPLLEGAAEFPRALFQMNLEVRLVGSRTRGDGFDEAEHDLTLSILLAARSTSRQSIYQARFLFGLDGAGAEALCAARLSDLQQLASVPGVLRCAFRECQWFWHGLFTATRPEVRRQLLLMALQPGAAAPWPQRRPAQPSVS
jgi:hypothetical protein